ncbi:MAG: ATP-binding protein [Candidatus Kapabacteria bacterium]|nr:ATP-binding protein [Candidatus Kapabacteria bacterium]
MTDPSPHTANTTIAAATSELAALRDFVRSHIMAAGFTDFEVNGIVLAIDEACANLIRHGYHNDASKTIDVIVDVTGPDIRIDILDTATSFDPAVVPRPDMHRYAADRRRGGWGVAIMMRVMDAITYTPIGATGSKNRLTLVKHRPLIR